jgi:hypothetical protein
MLDEKTSLAEKIRDKLDAGLLPRILPEKMWAGYGHDNPCGGCSEPILPAQVEYEFQGAGELRPRVPAPHRLRRHLDGRTPAPGVREAERPDRAAVADGQDHPVRAWRPQGQGHPPRTARVVVDHQREQSSAHGS